MWAKWLHHPCRLGGPQRLARGQKSEMAMLPTCGQSGYITPAILGVPNAVLGSATLSAGTKPGNGYVAHMWAKWLHHPCRLRGLQRSARGQESEIFVLSTPQNRRRAHPDPHTLGSSNVALCFTSWTWSIGGPLMGLPSHAFHVHPVLSCFSFRCFSTWLSNSTALLAYTRQAGSRHPSCNLLHALGLFAIFFYPIARAFASLPTTPFYTTTLSNRFPSGSCVPLDPS